MPPPKRAKIFLNVSGNKSRHIKLFFTFLVFTKNAFDNTRNVLIPQLLGTLPQTLSGDSAPCTPGSQLPDLRVVPSTNFWIYH